MKTVLYIFLLFNSFVYVAQGDDFFSVEQQNKTAEIDAARVQENLRKAEALQQAKKEDEANRIAAIKAKAAEDKANALAKAANEERQKDKARAQAQEDEVREYIKQQSALKIEQEAIATERLRAETLGVKSKADLESAIANDRIKSIGEETNLARKKEATEIDVIQSGADVNRTLAGGAESYLSGVGNEGLYKFLVVISLIILVLLIAVIAWLYSKRKNTSNPVNVKDNEDQQNKNL